MSSPPVCPVISSLPASFARMHRVYAFISCQTSATAHRHQRPDLQQRLRQVYDLAPTKNIWKIVIIYESSTLQKS